MVSIDLHGLNFEEGKNRLIKTLNECIVDGDPDVEIIHGYHGHAFKDYIESEEFFEDLEEEGIYISFLSGPPNPGVSRFRIENVFEQ